MRVLIYVSSMSGGGAERVVATLSNHWCTIGWQVAVVTVTGKDGDFYELDSRVTRVALDAVQRNQSGLLANVRRIVGLHRTIRDFRPDVSLSMMDTANVVLAIANLGCAGGAAIGSERVHPPAVPMRGHWAILRWWCYGHLAAVTALTAESAQWLLRRTRARKVPVIPNPVRLPLPSSSPILPPNSVGNPARKRLLAVGRLTEQKGFDLLVQAFAQLASRFPNWELVIVGEGPLRQSLSNAIGSAGLSQRVFLPGRIGNLGDWYASADAFVLSSRFEGFPNTLVEAMAHGLPSVSFDCESGPRDIICNGRDGILVPPGDVSALADALARFFGDDTLRGRLGQEASEVLERYSIDRVSAMWEQLFAEVRV